MKFFHKLSIKRKMTAVIMFTSCIALILACCAFIAYELVTFRSEFIVQMKTLAQITGRSCTVPLTFPVNRAYESVSTLNNIGENVRDLLSIWIYHDGKMWTNWSKSPAGTNWMAD